MSTPYSYNEFTIEMSNNLEKEEIFVSIFNLSQKFEKYLKPSSDTLTETLDDLFELLNSIFSNKIESTYNIKEYVDYNKADFDYRKYMFVINTEVPYGLKRTKKIILEFPNIHMDRQEAIEKRVMKLEKTILELKEIHTRELKQMREKFELKYTIDIQELRDKLERKNDEIVEEIGCITILSKSIPILSRSLNLCWQEEDYLFAGIQAELPRDHESFKEKPKTSLKCLRRFKNLTNLTIKNNDWIDYEYIASLEDLRLLEIHNVNIFDYEDIFIDIINRLENLVCINMWFHANNTPDDYTGHSDRDTRGLLFNLAKKLAIRKQELKFYVYFRSKGETSSYSGCLSNGIIKEIKN